MSTPRKTTKRSKALRDITDTRFECPRCGRLHRGNQLSPGALSATCAKCHASRKPRTEVKP